MKTEPSAAGTSTATPPPRHGPAAAATAVASRAPDAKPDVTVVVAAYNVQDCIERAVGSALEQAGVSLEVVVVNDCSSDDTPGVLQGIGDARLRVLRLAANGGPSAARNAAFAAARGGWLAVLDGDDAFAPGRLACLLELGRAQGADIVVDNPLVVPEPAGDVFPMFPRQSFDALGVIDLPALIRSSRPRVNHYPLHCTKPLFRTAFVREHQLRYDESTKLGEDYLILAEALVQGARCVVSPTTGYLYSRRVGSISRSISAREWGLMLDADRAFLQRHALGGEAAAAQGERTQSMLRMRNYQRVVEAIKERRWADSLGTATRHPGAALLLWQPVANRLTGLLDGFRQGRGHA